MLANIGILAKKFISTLDVHLFIQVCSEYLLFVEHPDTKISFEYFPRSHSLRCQNFGEPDSVSIPNILHTQIPKWHLVNI